MNLLQLDNVVNPPVNFSEDAHYSGFGHCHTLNIDPTSQLLCAMGTNTFNGGPHILDISNPLNPVFVGGYGEAGYTHDGFITTYSGPDQNHQGEVIIALCNGYNGFYVVNATDPNDVILLDNYLYPETGYTHQGWFTKDKRYFLINDELETIPELIFLICMIWITSLTWVSMKPTILRLITICMRMISSSMRVTTAAELGFLMPLEPTIPH
jgi:choice-of-anchor B domain-containing protein